MTQGPRPWSGEGRAIKFGPFWGGVCRFSGNFHSGRTSLTFQLRWDSESMVRPSILPALGMDGCICVKPRFIWLYAFEGKVVTFISTLHYSFSSKFLQKKREGKRVLAQHPTSLKDVHLLCELEVTWRVQPKPGQRHFARVTVEGCREKRGRLVSSHARRGTCFLSFLDMTKQNTWCSDFFMYQRIRRFLKF